MTDVNDMEQVDGREVNGKWRAVVLMKNDTQRNNGEPLDMMSVASKGEAQKIQSPNPYMRASESGEVSVLPRKSCSLRCLSTRRRCRTSPWNSRVSWRKLRHQSRYVPQLETAHPQLSAA